MSVQYLQSKMSSNESWTRPGEDKILFSNHPVVSAYPRSHLTIIHCWAQREINSLGLSYICTGRLSWENNGEANDKLVHQVVSFIIGNTIIDDLLLLFIRLSSLAWTNDKLSCEGVSLLLGSYECNYRHQYSPV